ncbi:hypothetical protein [Mycetohabitans endofungorum]
MSTEDIAAQIAVDTLAIVSVSPEIRYPTLHNTRQKSDPTA